MLGDADPEGQSAPETAAAPESCWGSEGTQAHARKGSPTSHRGRQGQRGPGAAASVGSAGRAGAASWPQTSGRSARPPEGLTLAWGLAPALSCVPLRAVQAWLGARGVAGTPGLQGARVEVRHWRVDKQGPRCKDGCLA